jgi:hypothetical protein
MKRVFDFRFIWQENDPESETGFVVIIITPDKRAYKYLNLPHDFYHYWEDQYSRNRIKKVGSFYNERIKGKFKEIDVTERMKYFLNNS